MKSKLTILDVAAGAGASISSVSAALNRRPEVSEEGHPCAHHRGRTAAGMGALPPRSEPFGPECVCRPVGNGASTFDGVEFDGRVNRNSGAESTIHGLLAMIALDAHPQAAALAASVTGYRWVGLHHVEAESGALSGGAAVVTPPSTWTGAANWSGGAYVSVPRGGSVQLAVTADEGAFVHPVVNRRKGQLGTSRYLAVSKDGGRTLLGILDNGGLRETGVIEAEGLLRPFPLSRPLPSGTVAVVVESDGDLQLDCLLIHPAVSTVRYTRGDDQPAVLYVNADTRPSTTRAVAPGRGWRGAPTGHAAGRRTPPPCA